MSGIVLSSSVRQNLLSLQSTADLLATTQNRLSTGKKVNTALDNPTNFFTAQSLDARAGDINNLLDGTAGGTHAASATSTLGGTIGTVTAAAAVTDTSAANITAATKIYDPTAGLTTGATTAFTDGTVLNVNGHSITFKAGAAATA